MSQTSVAMKKQECPPTKGVTKRASGKKSVKIVPIYLPPKKMCVVHDCDDPNQTFEVFDGRYSEGVPETAFIFEPRTDLIRHGYYVHSKSGKIYNVLGVIRQKNSDFYYVLYLGGYCPSGEQQNRYWRRSLDDFQKIVDLPDKGKVPRFRYRGF